VASVQRATGVAIAGCKSYPAVSIGGMLTGSDPRTVALFFSSQGVPAEASGRSVKLACPGDARAGPKASEEEKRLALFGPSPSGDPPSGPPPGVSDAEASPVAGATGGVPGRPAAPGQTVVAPGPPPEPLRGKLVRLARANVERLKAVALAIPGVETALGTPTGELYLVGTREGLTNASAVLNDLDACEPLYQLALVSVFERTGKDRAFDLAARVRLTEGLRFGRLQLPDGRVALGPLEITAAAAAGMQEQRDYSVELLTVGLGETLELSDGLRIPVLASTVRTELSERQDVQYNQTGRTLTITPQLRIGGALLIDLETTQSSQAGESDLGPAFRERRIKTKARVELNRAFVFSDTATDSRGNSASLSVLSLGRSRSSSRSVAFQVLVVDAIACDGPTLTHVVE
jgi:hypothetical protein